MMQKLINIIYNAGMIILKFKKSQKFFLKEDKSPVTLADRASHHYLCENLLKLKNIPILSEENIVQSNFQKRWKEFWVIDPLDGTKEFINGFSDYCINVALIESERPVLGIIYAPALEELYWAELNNGFNYSGPHYIRQNAADTITAVSRFHHSTLTEKFMHLNGITTVSILGSALKFGRLAVGQIDLYPRFEGSKLWDIAAGQVILKEAKCSIIDMKTKKSPIYCNLSSKNNYFVAAGPNINLDYLRYPIPL